MIPLLQKISTFFEEGTYLFLPLFMVCILMWIFILERIFFYGNPPWKFLLRSSQRRAEARARLGEAITTYVMESTKDHRQALMAQCVDDKTPYGRFIRRVFLEGVPRSNQLRDLQIVRARRIGEMEIRQGLGLIKILTRIALLLGLAGMITGMVHTLRNMTLSTTTDPEAWASGMPFALMATEIGLVIALIGVAGTGWLAHRARFLMEEISLASRRLGEILPRFGEEVFQ